MIEEDVVADAKAQSSAKGAEREIDVIEVEAVESLGVEAHFLSGGAAGGEENAIERVDVGLREMLRLSVDLDVVAFAVADRRLHALPVYPGLPGAVPAPIQEPRSAGNADHVEKAQVPGQALAEIRREDLDVVVAEDDDIAARLVEAAVIALAERARIRDADDLVTPAPQPSGIPPRALREAPVAVAPDPNEGFPTPIRPPNLPNLASMGRYAVSA